MPKTKASPPLAIVGVVLLGYHLVAFAKDAERAAANWQRFNQNSTANNLLRALLAEGILIRDLGLGE